MEDFLEDFLSLENDVRQNFWRTSRDGGAGFAAKTSSILDLSSDHKKFGRTFDWKNENGNLIL